MREMYEVMAQAAHEKKADHIEILDMQGVTLVSDYFVICSANNNKQTQSIADNIEDMMKEAGYPVMHTEGYREGRWILLDFGDAVAHIFVKEDRDFYDLDNLWSDAKRIEFIGE